MNGAVPLPLADYVEAPAIIGAADAVAQRPGNLVGYLLLFVPFALATALAPVPLVSYVVAWAGSLWILWLTIGGHVKPLPGGVSALDQVMRPLMLTQILFASYSFLTSIFYMADLHGFYYLTQVSDAPVVAGAVEAVALAQRYYVLAHAALATGILVAMDYRRSGEWVVRPFENPARAALMLSAAALIIGSTINQQNQFGVRIVQIGLVSSVLALALAIPTRRLGTLVLAFALYGVNLGSAFLSGWKEEVLVMVLLLAVFVYPYARRTVLLGAPIALVFLLAILPTYAAIFRDLSWRGGTKAEDAAAVAFDEIQSGQTNVAANNWNFLTGRISVIGDFTQYIYDMEGHEEYYGTQLIQQAAIGLVPRALWPSKPNMENLVMERVYWHGVADERSTISAKPQYVVDGYLSYGAWGVLAAGMAFGLFASVASRACERWFGGYFWGSGLVYTSMFAIFWKGNCFEFFFPVVLWSFVLLVPLFYLARAAGLILHSREAEDRVEWEEAALDPVEYGGELRRA